MGLFSFMEKLGIVWLGIYLILGMEWEEGVGWVGREKWFVNESGGCLYLLWFFLCIIFVNVLLVKNMRIKLLIWYKDGVYIFCREYK